MASFAFMKDLHMCFTIIFQILGVVSLLMYVIFYGAENPEWEMIMLNVLYFTAPMGLLGLALDFYTETTNPKHMVFVYDKEGYAYLIPKKFTFKKRY
eukprot:CAMPEP_0168330018 /NCGR_PEP_ID=MMETSP0213-20121227/7461_1 /TAXON_ID=151035 /ORGANISM="Euplotes harpa, Strain FSP1.4" /LENGTH=96 /DNA_ID=CAMNT_0008333469 /DNA_START=183 /DNA_END=473 /DNA_ORIENTATION=-